MSNATYAGHLELNFFDSAQFETEHKTASERNAPIIARNALRVLMMGWNNNCSKLVSNRTLNAVFSQRDPELLRGMRQAFQEGFAHIHQQLLTKSPLTSVQHEQAQLYLSNCLSLLPFADLNPYELIAIPQWIDGNWQRVEYKITPIELTPTYGVEALFIQDKDRVYAYGLEPINQPNAEPHLIFMGTTYPAGQGLATQIGADLNPFETAGKTLYRTGHKKITEWLASQEQKTHVCGVSLGGSLSLLLAAHQGDKLSRVDALNPVGLYDPLRKSQFDNWDKLAHKPRVIVQKQGNDVTSQ